MGSGKRYWDGNVREVVSVRFSRAANDGHPLRIEKLSCGHEQSFEGMFHGRATPPSTACAAPARRLANA